MNANPGFGPGLRFCSPEDLVDKEVEAAKEEQERSKPR